MAVQPIWTRKHVSGRKVHQRMGPVMRWAIVQGLADRQPAGEPITAALPQRPAPGRDRRALPHGEVDAAIAAVRSSDAWVGKKLGFEPLVLTATRLAEVGLARWGEVDLAVWGRSRSRG